jgi:hypothetical protein
MLLCKYNLHHDTGDPVEDILLGFDEVSLDDRHLEPELELQQTAGEAIEDFLPGFDEASISNRLMQYRLWLQRQTPREAPEVDEVVSGLAEVSFHGLMCAAHYLTVCLDRAAKNGARLAPNPSFSDEKKLFDALAVAQRLPARPTTQAEAFCRIQAALYAVKLLQEHLLPRCIDHLKQPTDLALAPPAATAQAASSSSSMEQARSTLDDAYILLNLAIKHIDLAIAAISRFVHPKEVASNSRFADSFTSIGWDEQLVTLERFYRRSGKGDLLSSLRSIFD